MHSFKFQFAIVILGLFCLWLLVIGTISLLDMVLALEAAALGIGMFVITLILGLIVTRSQNKPLE